MVPTGEARSGDIMPFSHLILQITDSCPLECAYCCVESGPNQKATMALEDARSYVLQAKTLNPDFYLSFTGGEPFVRFALMRDIAAQAHEVGVWHTTITSAVWCKTREFAYERLSELKRYGLRTISISYDTFHQPWVSVENIQNGILASLDLELRVLVAGSRTKNSLGAVDLLGEWLRQYPSVKVSDGAVQPTGRAAAFSLDELFVEDWGHRNLRCPVTEDLLIRADGTTYPCCSTGGDYDFLILGNARETSLAQLRQRADSAEWYQVITKQGFKALERLVQRYYPEVELPRQHIGVCHLCKLAFDRGEVGTKLRDALQRHAAGEPPSALNEVFQLIREFADPVA